MMNRNGASTSPNSTPVLKRVKEFQSVPFFHHRLDTVSGMGIMPFEGPKNSKFFQIILRNLVFCKRILKDLERSIV